MRKLILSIFVLGGLLFSAQAQEEGQSFGMNQGDISLEVNLLPANNVPIQMNNLTGRFALANGMVARLGFEFDINRTKNETTEGTAPNVTITESMDRTFDFGISPGIEKHHSIGARLKPYYGAEIVFLKRSSINKVEDNQGFLAETKNDRGFTNFGINAIAGFDIYIYQGLYVGVELGYGLNRTTYPDVETTNQNGGSSTTNTTENNQVDFAVGDNVNNAIRLGWTF